jgi:hypothetical protein
MIRFLVILVVVAAVLVACGGHAEAPIPKPLHDLRESEGNRFTVERVCTFQAATEDRASRRTIYVVTDTTNGTEYLAIEGCGTSQLVRVPAGKTSHLEER